MKIINLGSQNSVLNKFISQMRDKDIQQDSMRFRQNLHRVGHVFAYEISKTLSYKDADVVTPLGIATIPAITDKIVVATILRAGLPLQEGILDCFDDAQNAFLGAFRKYGKGGKFSVNVDYCTAPGLDGKILILADTMLATGASLECAYNRLCENGTPVHTHFVCPIASQFAVENLKKSFMDKKDVTLWTAAIDEEVTSHYYIVPGLGDAGDLAFGDKI